MCRGGIVEEHSQAELPRFEFAVKREEEKNKRISPRIERSSILYDSPSNLPIYWDPKD